MNDVAAKLAEALRRCEACTTNDGVGRQAREALAAYDAAQAAAPAPEATPHTEFVLNELRSALNAMLTFFGMDEDESNKEVFEMARQAYDYAQIVMRPLEPWERQSLKDLRDCVGRWHEKAVAKGYDGVESMCDTAPAQAQQAKPVAWMYTSRVGIAGQRYFTRYQWDLGTYKADQVWPLYTHPSKAEAKPLHITVLVDWLAARYRAAGGKEGITDLSAFCEEVMRWTEAKHRIGASTGGGNG